MTKPKHPYKFPPQKAKLHKDEMTLSEPATNLNKKLKEKCLKAYAKMKNKK